MIQFFLVSFFLVSAPVYAQDIPDEERVKIYLNCENTNGNKCCEHLTASLAETLSVCDSPSNGPKRRALYAECIENPAGDNAVTGSCCEHLNEADAQLLQTCSHHKSGLTWEQIKQAIEIASAAFKASQGATQ